MKAALSMILAVAFILTFSMAHAEDTLNGAGASFPAPVYQAWAYDYNKATGIKLNYQSIGSGGGVRQITSRVVDFGASDDPTTPAQLKKDNLLQFPAVMGGVVTVVNIAGVRPGQMKLDSEAVCKVYLGEIKFWDDAKIKGMNPGVSLPHQEITTVHRSDGSGTNAIFTNYLSDTCVEFKTKVGEGKSVAWPVGIGGKGNEGVANYVKQTPNSIGYVEFAYAKLNNLTYTQLKNKAGNFVEPTFESFEDAAATGDFDAKKDFYAWINNTSGKHAWPIAGATFILLARDKKESNIKTVKFYEWAFKNGDAKAKELLYVALPKALKDKIRAYWKQHGLQ
ncbi:MAG: phosphate ABC transporter substrate-binding protein PstS [Nitrospirae bacterium]|nr:phosphate ABC transporter substrate-binding protein PstS [Nitrospirota bacterium]